jgi:hypothetical protein
MLERGATQAMLHTQRKNWVVPPETRPDRPAAERTHVAPPQSYFSAYRQPVNLWHAENFVFVDSRADFVG